MLHSIVATGPKDTRNFRIETPNVRNITGRDSLIHEIEVTAMQG